MEISEIFPDPRPSRCTTRPSSAPSQGTNGDHGRAQYELADRFQRRSQRHPPRPRVTRGQRARTFGRPPLLHQHQRPGTRVPATSASNARPTTSAAPARRIPISPSPEAIHHERGQKASGDPRRDERQGEPPVAPAPRKSKAAEVALKDAVNLMESPGPQGLRTSKEESQPAPSSVMAIPSLAVAPC